MAAPRIGQRSVMTIFAALAGFLFLLYFFVLPASPPPPPPSSLKPEKYLRPGTYVPVETRACARQQICEGEVDRTLENFAYPFAGLSAYTSPFGAEFLPLKSRAPLEILTLDHDDLITKRIRELGVWDPEKLRFFELYIDKLVASGRPVDSITFVDIGANIGALGLPMRALGVRTFLVEPVHMNLAMMRDTALKNGYTDNRLYILPVAFSNQTGTTTIEIAKSNHGASSIVQQKLQIESREVETRQSVVEDRLDNWIDFHVDLMKIDVEGMEKCVVEGALKLFFKKNVRCVVIEVWNNINLCNSPQGILQWIENQGFAVYRTEEWEFALSGLPPIEPWAKHLGKKQFKDWICMRNETLNAAA